MRVNTIFFLACIILISSSCTTKKPLKKKNPLFLEIKQLIFEPNFTFIILNRNIEIYEIKYSYKRKKEKMKKEKKFSRTLTSSELEILAVKLEKLLELEDNYVKPTLGGIEWNVDFSFNGVSKSIKIDNMRVQEVIDLFETLNLFIPKGKPKITII
jgi:hypothetical protein